MSIGVSGWQTIFALHNAARIAHPKSTWGGLEGNPVREGIEAVARMAPPEFLINVALNQDKAITGVYAGEYQAAWRAGCAEVRESAAIRVEQDFPLVITSNSGYPLDQNFYQSVKGLSAAARITREGGTILMLSACEDGLPAHGRFAELLEKLNTAKAPVAAGDEVVQDQWQVQLYAQILHRFEVALVRSVVSGKLCNNPGNRGAGLSGLCQVHPPALRPENTRSDLARRPGGPR